jgi:hypothetical protein
LELLALKDDMIHPAAVLPEAALTRHDNQDDSPVCP